MAKARSSLPALSGQWSKPLKLVAADTSSVTSEAPSMRITPPSVLATPSRTMGLTTSAKRMPLQPLGSS